MPTIHVAIIRGRASIACACPKALRMWIAGRADSLLYTIDEIPVLEVVKPIEVESPKPKL